MAKALQLKRQHEPQEVWRAYQKSRCRTEQRRLQALALLLEGRSRQDIAAVTQYSKSGLVDLINRYNQDGLDGLKDKRHGNKGAPRKLNDAQRAELVNDIKVGTEAGQTWSGKRLIEHIRTKYNLEVPEGSVYRILKELGDPLKKPRTARERGNSSP